jgi:diguanylate cyclase
MSKTTPNSSPAEIAREVLQRLAFQRVPPTPEAYATLYSDISGVPNRHPLEDVLAQLAEDLSGRNGVIAGLGQRLNKALAGSDWKQCGESLYAISEQTLLTAKGQLTNPDNARQFIHDSQKEKQLREILVRMLTFSMASLLKNAPELAQECKSVGEDLNQSYSEEAMNEALSRLKQLSFQIELKIGDMDKQQALMTMLFQLLLENMHALLDKDSWLSNQITAVHTMISSPMSETSLEEVTKSLKEVIYKQGLLKNTLEEEKIAVKNLMVTFIDRLGSMVSTTDTYYQTISNFSKKVDKAADISDLNSALVSMMDATREAQKEAISSRDNMVFAQQEVQRAEARIAALENELILVGEMVREDHLTGSLNRRGMDESLEREIHRANRFDTPLCIALLDLDDFKKINDTHGHATGDEVLVHLVKVVKDTLRKLDIIARFGGEEFMILLPETPAEEAVQIITRLQRELTKRIFMNRDSDENLLITFSAGVALLLPEETQHSLLDRADAALYKAKHAGKNRVVLADSTPITSE